MPYALETPKLPDVQINSQSQFTNLPVTTETKEGEWESRPANETDQTSQDSFLRSNEDYSRTKTPQEEEHSSSHKSTPGTLKSGVFRSQFFAPSSTSWQANDGRPDKYQTAAGHIKPATVSAVV